MGRILALDFGLKRIGVAISDPLKMIAQARGVITTERHMDLTAGKVLKAFEAEELEAIVVGMPLMMSGKVGHLADEVRAFIAALKKYTDVPVVPFDERLTSVQADRSLREANLSRKKRAAKVDTVAAVILLQCYLEMLSLEGER